MYTTFYLLLLMSLGHLATDIYLPSLPALSEYFQVSEHDVQMTLFAYLISFSITPLIFGPLSDHLGRKKVLLIGIIISIFATFGCVFAQNIFFLKLARFLQGMGTGAVLISSRAAISDLYTGKGLARQMGFMTMLMPLVLALAPTLGGILQETFGWQANFIFLTGYMVLLCILILFKSESRKTLSTEKISQIFSTYRLHLQNRLYILYGVNFLLPAFAFFAYLTVSPFLFQEIIGLSPREYGSLAMYIGATIILSGYMNLKLIHRYSIVKVIRLGSFLSLFAGVLLLGFYLMDILTTWSLLLPVLLFFTCLPFSSSNAASKSLGLVKSGFGSASALLTTSQFVTGALGSFIFSFIPNQTDLYLALCFISVGALSLLTLSYACKLEQVQETLPVNPHTTQFSTAAEAFDKL